MEQWQDGLMEQLGKSYVNCVLCRLGWDLAGGFVDATGSHCEIASLAAVSLSTFFPTYLNVSTQLTNKRPLQSSHPSERLFGLYTNQPSRSFDFQSTFVCLLIEPLVFSFVPPSSRLSSSTH